MTTCLTIDGNEAVARMAYLGNEVIAIYPITPASSMGEWSDEWASQGRPNLWGAVPKIIEMQSEGGAAGALHGALTSGALATSFTASQGLLLMIPNLYKIAGELSPFVLHVAARTLATHALSIFGDHSDVMAARATGCAMLCGNSVQEAQDFALIAQAATLAGRIPVIHFFDGFRTSHEVAKIVAVEPDTVRAMLDAGHIAAHRARALSPEHPVLRGTSQNPDVFFQSRERVNPFYDAFPGVMQAAMDRFGELTGRRYRLFEYVGAADAERVIVLMGSGAETVHEVVEHLAARGEKIGVLKVRLYRPFSAEALLAAVPASVKAIAVLDRCKEPGADGEPLYKDVVTALAQAADGVGAMPHKGTPTFSPQGGGRGCNADESATTTHYGLKPVKDRMPRVIGGRYGLASKEFTPGMVAAVFDELSRAAPRRQFTIGIHDDVTHLSLPWDVGFRTDAAKHLQHAVFWGLGADGTVSANKNSIKIVGEATDLQAQGYFVYDSKKSGAVTVSHLRFGAETIRSTYLVEAAMAGFVACHQTVFVERYDLLAHAAPGGVFLLNTPDAADQVWDTLPAAMRTQIWEKHLRLWVIDAYAVAAEAGLGRRINTIMQTCFFAISGILQKDEAIAAIKRAVDKTYGRKSKHLAELNYRAIDMTLAKLHLVSPPPAGEGPGVRERGLVTDAVFPHLHPCGAPRSRGERGELPDFVRDVTLPIYQGLGDRLPVSLMPEDGTFPIGTAQYEKRNIALEIPVWEADLCTQCGKCVFVCPHSAIRARAFSAESATNAPASFKHVPARSKDFPAGTHISYQVAPEDCTGCGDCVEACPIHDKSNVSRRAVNMAPQAPLREQERDNYAFFLALPEFDRSAVKHTTIPGSMLLDPLFEYSGACAGCGETPYIRLATQLFGDRMLIANATGCSSIYGGNLPTTPYTVNGAGRGPAWSNSLFEDNAEFGLGMRLAADQLMDYAKQLVRELAHDIGGDLAEALVNADQREEAGLVEQRRRVAALLEKLATSNHPRAKELASVAEWLIRRSVWIIGGDGWAYDIGYGGLDHVLALPYDINILVLDTEVYSNTGGQTSKATPIGAVAKFSAGGKATAKKDLAKLASDYGHVYVATVAYGAKDTQTLRVFHEAESYAGPSLIVAYSPCIAHGVDLLYNQRQQDMAVKTGHWPLFRFDPRLAETGGNPFKLDSAPPSQPIKAFMDSETRFAMLARSHPEAAQRFMAEAQKEAERRFKTYQDMAQGHANEPKPGA